METRDLAPWNWLRKTNLPTKRRNSFIRDKYNMDIEKMFENFVMDFSDFNAIFQAPDYTSINTQLKILPRTDLSETDKEYIVEADLPGVQEKDLDISISKDGTLTIKGKRESKEEKKERNYYRLERSYGSFERHLCLPEDCDTNQVNTSFKDGALIIKISKKEPSLGEVKRIKINNK